VIFHAIQLLKSISSVLLRQEAIPSIEKLARRKKKPAAKKFSLTWAGGLSHLKSSMTSVELQLKSK
jgi:hypothetical protein